MFIYNNKPVFIDILSIEPLEGGAAWNAYKQFCEFFLAPLLLSYYFPGNWNKQLMIHLEGIPLKKLLLFCHTKQGLIH